MSEYRILATSTPIYAEPRAGASRTGTIGRGWWVTPVEVAQRGARWFALVGDRKGFVLLATTEIEAVKP